MTDNTDNRKGLLDDNGTKDEAMGHDQGKAQEPDLREVEAEEAKNARENPQKWMNHWKELVFEYRKLLQQSKSNYYKKDGDVGYLLNLKWLDRWKEVVYYDQFYRNIKAEFDPERETQVPEVDNESLLRPRNEFLNDEEDDSYYNYILKKDLKMNYDYKAVDEETWSFFHSRYGGTEIKRFYYKAYTFGAEIEAKLKEYRIVVLPTLEEWDKNNISDTLSIFSSKHDSFQNLLERTCKALSSNKNGAPINTSPELIRPWKLAYNGDIDKIDEEIKASKDEKMDEDENVQGTEGKTIERNTGVEFPGTSLEMMRKYELEDLELSISDILVIERASPETKKFIFYYEKIEILGYGKCEYCYSHKPLVVQCRCKEVKYCSDECLKKDQRFHDDKCNAPIDIGNDTPFTKKDRARNGLTGLQNLGNTCFMNSSIQCLSNTFALTQYFLQEFYKNEINSDNVLGTGGKLAVQFARLLNELWNEESPVVTPWSFKKIVGNFQPMFSGFAQHDSAELLSFVLDGLHEDLNRVVKKPYYEMPDIEQSTNELKRAELSWKYHLLRNQSVIVDLMQGQYKSTLCCPKCNNISETYDPYMLLSLPIPQNEIASGVYYFMPYDAKICPPKSKYFLKKSASILELRKQIAEQNSVEPWSFVLCIIENKQLERMLCRNRTVGDIAEEDGCLFAFQIDPAIYDSQKDPDEYKKCVRALELGDTAVDMSNDDDFNNGISRDWVKVPLRLTMMQKAKYSYYESKKPLSFPRLMWINRNWDLITVHKQVFNFLRYYFDFHLEGFHTQSEEEAFISIFENLTEENYKEKLGEGDDPGDYTYTLNIVNPEKKTFYSKGVEFFGINNFTNISIPFEQNKTFGDLIDAFFLEYENKEDSDDDDMDYDMATKEKQPKTKTSQVKNNKNDAFYFEEENKYNSKRRIFELEVFWNKDNQQAALEKLDRCKKHPKFIEIENESTNATSEDITLNQWFESFMTPEMLGKDNAWYCRTCKEHVEAMKKMELFNTPPLILISLKRFKSGRGSYFKDKLEDKVYFPIDHLDISDIVLSNKNEDGSRKKDIVYELYAVSNHYGNMGFGHYTAYAKNPLDNNWYDFDDSHVTQMSDPTGVVTDAAYNLFYRRKDFNFSEDVDFEKLKHSWDFEEFKTEVAHYAVPEKKKETTDDEKASKSVQDNMEVE